MKLKVTVRRLKIRAAWATFKMLPTFVALTYHRMRRFYAEVYGEILKAWQKNPDIKW